MTSGYSWVWDRGVDVGGCEVMPRVVAGWVLWGGVRALQANAKKTDRGAVCALEEGTPEEEREVTPKAQPQGGSEWSFEVGRGHRGSRRGPWGETRGRSLRGRVSAITSKIRVRLPRSHVLRRTQRGPRVAQAVLYLVARPPGPGCKVGP